MVTKKLRKNLKKNTLVKRLKPVKNKLTHKKLHRRKLHKKSRRIYGGGWIREILARHGKDVVDNLVWWWPKLQEKLARIGIANQVKLGNWKVPLAIKSDLINKINDLIVNWDQEWKEHWSDMPMLGAPELHPAPPPFAIKSFINSKLQALNTKLQSMKIEIPEIDNIEFEEDKEGSEITLNKYNIKVTFNKKLNNKTNNISINDNNLQEAQTIIVKDAVEEVSIRNYGNFILPESLVYLTITSMDATQRKLAAAAAAARKAVNAAQEKAKQAIKAAKEAAEEAAKEGVATAAVNAGRQAASRAIEGTKNAITKVANMSVNTHQVTFTLSITGYIDGTFQIDLDISQCDNVVLAKLLSCILYVYGTYKINLYEINNNKELNNFIRNEKINDLIKKLQKIFQETPNGDLNNFLTKLNEELKNFFTNTDKLNIDFFNQLKKIWVNFQAQQKVSAKSDDKTDPEAEDSLREDNLAFFHELVNQWRGLAAKWAEAEAKAEVANAEAEEIKDKLKGTLADLPSGGGAKRQSA